MEEHERASKRRALIGMLAEEVGLGIVGGGAIEHLKQRLPLDAAITLGMIMSNMPQIVKVTPQSGIEELRKMNAADPLLEEACEGIFGGVADRIMDLMRPDSDAVEALLNEEGSTLG